MGIVMPASMAMGTNARKVEMIPFGTQSRAVTWRKSSFCQNGECAEIADYGGEVLLRSSRSPDDVIRLTPGEWQALVEGVRAGEFPDLG